MITDISPARPVVLSQDFLSPAKYFQSSQILAVLRDIPETVFALAIVFRHDGVRADVSETGELSRQVFSEQSWGADRSADTLAREAHVSRFCSNSSLVTEEIYASFDYRWADS